MSAPRTIRGRVAIAGVGETAYYKHGRAPESEFALALRAILRACEDAGIDPRQVDGFASYSNDRNDPSRLAAALGLPELRFSNMQWGGGGGGGGRGLRRVRGGLPRAGAGAVPAVRGRAPRRHGVGRGGAHVPLRPHLAGPALRDAGDALHARPRGAAGGAAGHRARVLPSRPGEPESRDARPAA